MAPVLQLIGCYFSWLCNNQLFATVNNTIYKYLKVIFQKKGQFLVAKNVHDKVCMKFQFHIIFSFKLSLKAFKSFTCYTLNNKLSVLYKVNELWRLELRLEKCTFQIFLKNTFLFQMLQLKEFYCSLFILHCLFISWII